jgi:hypothetical protein
MIEEEEDSSNYHVDYDYSSSFFPPAGDHCDRMQCLLLLFLRCCEWRKIQHQYRKADSPYSPQPFGTDNDICGFKRENERGRPPQFKIGLHLFLLPVLQILRFEYLTRIYDYQ